MDSIFVKGEGRKIRMRRYFPLSLAVIILMDLLMALGIIAFFLWSDVSSIWFRCVLAAVFLSFVWSIVGLFFHRPISFAFQKVLSGIVMLTGFGLFIPVGAFMPVSRFEFELLIVVIPLFLLAILLISFGIWSVFYLAKNRDMKNLRNCLVITGDYGVK